MTKPLDPRLEAAASFVEPGAVVADVGTDHAYLPLYLLETGAARFAVASDINRGPLERARIAFVYWVTFAFSICWPCLRWACLSCVRREYEGQ